MIIDIHTHVGQNINGYEGHTFEELKKSMDKWGIDKCVVKAIHNTNESMIQQSLDILEKSKEFDWIIPFIRFDPKLINKEELEILLNKGFKGVKLHARAENFDIDCEDYFWIYELCEERNLPILFHSSVSPGQEFAHPRKIINIVKKYPKLVVIMAHFFGGDFQLMKEANRYPNLYVDTSMVSGSLKRNQAVNIYGFKNLLLGSDIPYDSQGVTLLKIREAGLNKEDEEMIFHGNAEKILNLK